MRKRCTAAFLLLEGFVIKGVKLLPDNRVHLPQGEKPLVFYLARTLLACYDIDSGQG